MQVTQQTLVQHISDYSLPILLTTVLSFLPTTSLLYTVQERVSKQKLLQASLLKLVPKILKEEM